MSRPHPIIGLTALRSPYTDSFHHVLTGNYLRAITAAGGFPIVLPALPDQCDEALDLVSGLLLIGGGDIEARHLGAQNHPRAKYFNPARDEFELAIIPKAFARRMPLLGVCRGEQLLNVALGGTLYQDIGDEQGSPFEHLQEDKPDQAVHAVSVAPESCLAAILGTTQVSVNSTHHQAVRDVAPGLKAVAWARDGVIEAVESGDGGNGFILAVQWHPERLVDHQPEQRHLFEKFVNAARHYGEKSG